MTEPRPLLFALPGNEAMAAALAAHMDAELGEIEVRRFPDEETYLRLLTNPSGRSVALVCTLDRPDLKFLPIVFAASAARQLGAIRVGLVAPYLSYLRQDKRFRAGEAITSASFAAALSSEVDWLVTVDPHLHRYGSLDAVYRIPASAVAAAPAIASWISANVADPLLIGPDSESEQWVASVAALVGAPHKVLAKERLGDRNVRISVSELDGLTGRTPVLIDDIVSSAQTMLQATRLLRERTVEPATCIAVHALFAQESFAELGGLAGEVVSTNTVLHPSNAIDVSPAIALEARRLISGPPVARDDRRRPRFVQTPTSDLRE
jgi:ribose-phosphate pyrophosphokinase